MWWVYLPPLLIITLVGKYSSFVPVIWKQQSYLKRLQTFTRNALALTETWAKSSQVKLSSGLQNQMVPQDAYAKRHKALFRKSWTNVRGNRNHQPSVRTPWYVFEETWTLFHNSQKLIFLLKKTTMTFQCVCKNMPCNITALRNNKEDCFRR